MIWQSIGSWKYIQSSGKVFENKFMYSNSYLREMCCEVIAQITEYGSHFGLIFFFIHTFYERGGRKEENNSITVIYNY